MRPYSRAWSSFARLRIRKARSNYWTTSRCPRPRLCSSDTDLRFPQKFRSEKTLNWQAIALSLKLAVCVAAILLAAGLPIAYWVTFSRWRWKFLVEAIVALPLVLPPTVLGYYILVGLGPRHVGGRIWQSLFGHTLPFTFAGLLVASVLYSLPFAVQPFSAGFEAVDRRLIEASWTLGASRLATFFRVILAALGGRSRDGSGAEFCAHASGNSASC